MGRGGTTKPEAGLPDLTLSPAPCGHGISDRLGSCGTERGQVDVRQEQQQIEQASTSSRSWRPALQKGGRGRGIWQGELMGKRGKVAPPPPTLVRRVGESVRGSQVQPLPAPDDGGGEGQHQVVQQADGGGGWGWSSRRRRSVGSHPSGGGDETKMKSRCRGLRNGATLLTQWVAQGRLHWPNKSSRPTQVAHWP